MIAEGIARRPLRGELIAPKERCSPPVAGTMNPPHDGVNYPTTSGTAALRNFRPKDDAPIVRALRAAGAIVLGKTNLHELSFGWTSTNLTFGAVKNPYDPARIPGGSSGGTAVAVATRMAPLGVAEDTAGSIRVPAAMCGIAGLRPTTFRYSPRGVMPLTSVFDTVGPHARTVTDLALFDSVITGDFSPLRPVAPSGLRLGVSRAHYFADLDPEVARVADEALKKLRDAGVTLVEADVPDVTRLVTAANSQIILHEALPMIRRYLEEFETGVTWDQLFATVGENVKRPFAASAVPGGQFRPSDQAYEEARNVHRPALQQVFRDLPDGRRRDRLSDHAGAGDADRPGPGGRDQRQEGAVQSGDVSQHRPRKLRRDSRARAARRTHSRRPASRHRARWAGRHRPRPARARSRAGARPRASSRAADLRAISRQGRSAPPPRASVPRKTRGDDPQARRARSENGRLCHGDGTPGRGARRRRGLMLPTLRGAGNKGVGERDWRDLRWADGYRIS